MSLKSKNSSFRENFSELNEQSVYEVRVNLSQLKCSEASTMKRPKSCVGIEEILMERHKKSQARIGAERIRKKSLDFEDFTFVPRICRKKYKSSYPKYTKKVQEMFDNIERIENSKKENKSLRPRDIIDKPDLCMAKDLFNTRNMIQRKEEKENPLKMSLFDKTKHFWNKRQESIKQADKEKSKNEFKRVHFKPDLRKILRKGEYTRSLALDNENRNRGSETRRQESLSRQSTLSRANSYNKISPDEQNYSFREGFNMKRLLEKSKPMLSYSITTKD
jgi:hypothetical protein